MLAWEKKRWPRGPKLDVAEEARKAVREAALLRRAKVGDPRQVVIAQLEGCPKVDWTIVAPLPTERPLRVVELFAGVGAAT